MFSQKRLIIWDRVDNGRVQTVSGWKWSIRSKPRLEKIKPLPSNNACSYVGWRLCQVSILNRRVKLFWINRKKLILRWKIHKKFGHNQDLRVTTNMKEKLSHTHTRETYLNLYGCLVPPTMWQVSRLKFFMQKQEELKHYKIWMRRWRSWWWVRDGMKTNQERNGVSHSEKGKRE